MYGSLSGALHPASITSEEREVGVIVIVRGMRVSSPEARNGIVFVRYGITRCNKVPYDTDMRTCIADDIYEYYSLTVSRLPLVILRSNK